MTCSVFATHCEPSPALQPSSSGGEVTDTNICSDRHSSRSPPARQAVNQPGRQPAVQKVLKHLNFRSYLKVQSDEDENRLKPAGTQLLLWEVQKNHTQNYRVLKGFFKRLCGSTENHHL
ncbi:hypothetical protein EYF80_031651 [Liparis tanakae]|uniref:Uncharacterized protein n=1 Tax=Liparis tanakae TaxID=230148 RepID=A0A4Z2GX17_9TELE|nr:hypothetical protein EYF80_031651 [Liparis tanakae]